MSAFPTLLYRLLRRGDVDALCDAAVHHRKMAARKRGRATADNAGEVGSSGPAIMGTGLAIAGLANQSS
jgi:hypothetical protein